jgi:Nuclease-related domain
VSVTRRLVVITGLAPVEVSVEAVLDDLRPSGWHLLRRPRIGAARLDHVVLGPGGVFLVLVRSGAGSLRPEWADEARALARMVARLARHAVTPLVVLQRAADWDGARRFHGVDVVPVGGLGRHLEARGDVLGPTELAELREALRLALAA